MARRVAIVGGNRIPFARSNGHYATASNQDMFTAALDGLVSRFGLQDERLGEVAAGAVLKHSRDFNLARESVLGSRLSPETPAYDIQQACGTGLQAVIQVANKIALEQIDAGVAGGVDTTSDAPLGLNEDLRQIFLELNRIHSHLVYLGTSALELGAISMFWYCFRERDMILDLSEMVTGQRMHTRYFQIGGLAEDIPEGFYAECRNFVEWMPKALDDYLALLDRNAIWLERTRGVGVLSAHDAIALGQTGPNLRASGVDWDLRRDQPYLAYEQVDFHVPVYAEGDVYARYRVRLEEMAESTKIVRQCLDRLERMEGMPWIADDRKVVLPPREELHTSMESLIHHFKIVTEGYRVPEGEVYVVIESPRGENGCYVVSDGGPTPWRVKFRAPSFAALEATATVVQHSYIADLIAIVGSLDTVMGEVDR